MVDISRIDKISILQFSILLVNLILTTLIITQLSFKSFGDQNWYINTAQLMLEGDFSNLSAQHRMPAITLLILPAVLLFGNSIIPIKIFLAIVTILLNYLLVRKLNQMYKPSLGTMYLLLITVSPLCLFFNTMIFSDYLAGILSLYLVLVLLSFTKNDSVSYKDLFKAGFISGIILLFRQSAITVLFLVLICFAVIYLLGLLRSASRVKISKAILRSAFAFLIGFFIIYGPWVISSSIKNSELIVHSSQLYDRIAMKARTISSPYSNYGIQRTVDFKEDLIKRGGAHAVLEEIRQKNDVFDYISAYWRNFKNIYLNENQFIAANLMITANPGLEGIKDDISILKREYTFGGALCCKQNNYIPFDVFLRSMLYFNSSLYYIILILIPGLLLSYFLAKKKISNEVIFSLAAITGFSLFIFFHPGHGRYIMTILPVILFLFCYLLMNERINRDHSSKND